MIIHATVKYMNVREQYTIHSYYHVLQRFRTQLVTSTPEPATRRTHSVEIYMYLSERHPPLMSSKNNALALPFSPHRSKKSNSSPLLRIASLILLRPARGRPGHDAAEACPPHASLEIQDDDVHVVIVGPAQRRPIHRFRRIAPARVRHRQLRVDARTGGGQLRFLRSEIGSRRGDLVDEVVGEEVDDGVDGDGSVIGRAALGHA